jgi:hypothetical protein
VFLIAQYNCPMDVSLNFHAISVIGGTLDEEKQVNGWMLYKEVIHQ